MVITMKVVFRAFLITLLIGLGQFVNAAQIPFPLPEGYFVNAKMPMHVVFPRPDSETQAHARHRWAHPNMAYEIPIGVQGGAWPFKYELVKAPTGATIGSMYGDDNYGSINWTPIATTGTVDFMVRVTDQQLNKVDISWKVTIDPSMFVFVKEGASGARTGTINAPLASFSDWFKTPGDSTYKNKIVVFREGVYSLVSDPAEKNNMRLAAESKTPSLIGYPGETPIIDGSKAKIMVSNLLDMFVAGITWKNARQDVADAHYFWLTGDVSRATFWRNHFRDMNYGLVGSDNTGPVFISATSTEKKYILYKENNHTNIQNKDRNGHYFDVYRASYVLVEQNKASNSKTANGFWMKGTVANVTVRANEAFDNVWGSQITIGYGLEAGEVPHDHEVCWNKIVVDPNHDGPAILMFNSDYYKGQSYNTFIYRNTVVGGASLLRFAGKDRFKADGNLIVMKKPQLWDKSIMETTISNIVETPTAGATVSAKYRASGDSFGKVGADVAVDAAPEPPQGATFKN